MAPQPGAPFTYLRSMDEVEDASAEVVMAMDVCEHLYEGEIEQLVIDAARTIKPNGRFIVSVPIMQGAALAMKEINRSLLFRRKSEYSLGELFTATFGGAVQRPPDPRPTHKGFDWRWVRDHLRRQFQFEKIFSGPLPAPWWTNSEIYFICKPQ